MHIINTINNINQIISYLQQLPIKQDPSILSPGRLTLWINKEPSFQLKEDCLKLARTAVKKETELKLAVVSYILDVKDKEAQEAKNAASKKSFNEGILSRLAKKQEAKLDDLSEEELLAMLK